VLDPGAADPLNRAAASALRSILVHVDATTESATRLLVACVLAERHQASVRALFGTAPMADAGSFAYSAGAALDEAEALRSLRLDQARAHLQRTLGDRAAEVGWYDIVGDSVGHGFVEEAMFADLVVLGQQPAAQVHSGGAPPASSSRS
jgi:hypothetical protein